MTLAFAVAASIPPEPPFVMVAADSRLSLGNETHSDTGIKICELGGRTAMVAAGQALPVFTAAEVVRPIVENHNRREAPAMLGFYDTVRLLAFFLKRAAEQQAWSCEVGVAGFLSSGVPTLAHIIVSPTRNKATFFSVQSDGMRSIPIGDRPAARFLMQGLAVAKRDRKPVLTSGLSLLWYMSQHPGAFGSIGGGVAVGQCAARDQAFSWPIVEFAGRRFLRGIDVTPYYRPSWPPPLVVPYDEEWCSELDQKVTLQEGTIQPVPVSGSSYEIDSMSAPDTLFQTHNDPEAFDGIACTPPGG